jgi:hypothetical protein
MPFHQKSYTKLPTWWAGMFMVIGGSIGDFLALGFGSQALCTALGGATVLATNVITAKYWQKESLSSLDLIGVACIIVGAVMISIVTPESEEYKLSELLEFSRATAFVNYMILMMILIAVLLGTIANSSFYKWRNKLVENIMSPLVKSAHDSPLFPLVSDIPLQLMICNSLFCRLDAWTACNC